MNVFGLSNDSTNKSIAKPEFMVDLHVWLRKAPFCTENFRKLKNNDTVHYLRHNVLPFFRLISASVKTMDTSYSFDVMNAKLTTYCKDSVVEINTQRRFSSEYNSSIYSGQNGLLPCSDKEILQFYVLYKKKNDPKAQTQVDSFKYYIMLDIEGSGNCDY